MHNYKNKRYCSNDDKHFNKTELVDIIRSKLSLRKNNDLLFEPNLHRTICSSDFKIQELGDVKSLNSLT